MLARCGLLVQMYRGLAVCLRLHIDVVVVVVHDDDDYDDHDDDDGTIQYNTIFVYYELTERSSTRET